MKLSFSTKIEDKPNYFLEKIWKGILQEHPNLENTYLDYQRRHLDKFGCFWDGDNYREFLNPKIHTIRRDVNKQWKKGMTINLVININENDEFQFAPVLKCQNTQNVQIDYSNFVITGPAVFVDYELYTNDQLEVLAINDGFTGSEEFFQYFNADFNGTLIHWTNQNL